MEFKNPFFFSTSLTVLLLFCKFLLWNLCTTVLNLRFQASCLLLSLAWKKECKGFSYLFSWQASVCSKYCAFWNVCLFCLQDIGSKITTFSQQGPRTVCILSANGAVCNVTLRQPAMTGGTVTYEVLLIFSCYPFDKFCPGIWVAGFSLWPSLDWMTSKISRS